MLSALLLAALTFAPPAPIVVPPGTEVSIPAASPNGPAVSLVLPFDTDKADKADLERLTSRVDALTETVAGLVRQSATAPGPQVHGHALTPAPTVYRLADRSGQVWTHTDAAWLRTWVDRRNASLAPVYGYAVGGGCANGRCPR